MLIERVYSGEHIYTLRKRRAVKCTHNVHNIHAWAMITVAECHLPTNGMLSCTQTSLYTHWVYKEWGIATVTNRMSEGCVYTCTATHPPYTMTLEGILDYKILHTHM